MCCLRILEDRIKQDNVKISSCDGPLAWHRNDSEETEPTVVYGYIIPDIDAIANHPTLLPVHTRFHNRGELDGVDVLNAGICDDTYSQTVHSRR